MKKEIQTEVQLVFNNVILNISTTENVKRRKDKLINWGFIEITSGRVDKSTIFWDNLDFFIECKFKSFKEECGADLKDRVSPKETYKTVKKLLKRAYKLKLLTKIK